MTIKHVEKRDGSFEKFDIFKIENAIRRAFKETKEEHNIDVFKDISKQIEDRVDKLFPTVEDIQDVVEVILMENGYHQTAKAYIIYREKHEQIRKMKGSVNESLDIIDNYIDIKDWRIRENSNMSYSLQGLNNHISSGITANYWLTKIYSRQVSNAHISGDFHIHDLGSLSSYCVGWDLGDLLEKGFGGVIGKVQSKPARHFRSALGQIVNFMYTMQGEAAGAQAFANFDTLLAPYIRYDNLSYADVKQAMQEFIFNLNVPTRTGFQTPFSNLTMDLTIPSSMRNRPVKIAGTKQSEKYGEFQQEMDMINTAFAEVMLEGDAVHRIFTFPIPTYNITKDFDWDNKHLTKVWEMTAKYGIPYFANFVNSDMDPDDARSMCIFPDEEIIVKNTGHIKRFDFETMINTYKEGEFDKEGWSECRRDKNLSVPSLNLITGKMEWTKVKRFLRIYDKYLITLKTEDGKVTRISKKHVIPVLTPKGIVNKFAEDIKKGDYLITLKNGEDLLNKKYEKIGDLTLDEDLAKFLGYFTADGNFLFENRKNMKHYGEPRGIQITFNAKTKEHLKEIKLIIKKLFNIEGKEKKDPRYNSYYLYIYNTVISRKLFEAGFKKYGRLPNILFNSPKNVIRAFLNYFFKGDGYNKRNEIHINDDRLSRDLAILYTMINKPVTFRKRKYSQVIRIQNKNNKFTKTGQINHTLSQLVPGFLAKSTYKVPGLRKSRMVSTPTLKKYNAHSKESDFIEKSDFYIIRVESIKKEVLANEQKFYDLELEKNHLFMHSMGIITHNCCRLRLDNREIADHKKNSNLGVNLFGNKTEEHEEHEQRRGGLFNANPLTGSIGVVTINLPRIAYLSPNKEAFLKRLEEKMEIAKESLEVKRKLIEKLTESNLYPYTRYWLKTIKDEKGEFWANHFSTIGLVGMNEAVLNFLKMPYYSQEGKEFGKEVLDFMLNKLKEFKKETGNLYNLEASPAESASYRLAKKDLQFFGDIITAGSTDTPYYTNSVHLPVWETRDVFETLDHQDDLQSKFTGGTVIHFFIGEEIHDIEPLKTLIKNISQNYKLPYFSITPTFSICPVHGYTMGEHWICEKEHSEEELKIYGKTDDEGNVVMPMEVYSRIVGYYRPVQNWNKGKQKEFKQRIDYSFNRALRNLK